MLRLILLSTAILLSALSAAIAHASGAATILPSSVRVESKVTVTLTYTAGPGGMASGDSLTIEDPVFHGASWSRWGALALWEDRCTPLRGDFDGVASHGKVSAISNADGVTLSVNRSNCNNKTQTCAGHYHALSWTEIIVESGSLAEGDNIVVTLGDTTENADCGLQTSPRSYPKVPWPVSDTIDGITTALVSPTISVTPIIDPAQMMVIAPSQVLAGEPFEVKVAVLDNWGNAIPKANLQTNLSFSSAGEGNNQDYNFSTNNDGWQNFTITIDSPTVEWVEVASPLGVVRSNPVEVLAALPEYQVYWGDIHSHHGYTWTDESGTRYDMNHIYARDVVGLDVATESLKAQYAEINGEALWTELQQTCHEMSVDGSYLVLQGFEWLGGLTGQNQGHHNVYYDSCDGPAAIQDDLTGIDGDEGIWAYAKSVRDDLGIDVVAVPHAMAYTGYYFDTYDNDIQKVAEIYSGWGDSMPGSGMDAEGGVDQMFQQDIRVGFIGSSDNHDGWMGNPYYLSETNGSRGGGYVAFLAKSLTRADIFESLKQRRTYATTANRGIVHFYAEDKGARLEMGSEYLAQAPTVHWTAHGAAEIARVELFTIEMGGTSASTTLLDETYNSTWSVEGSYPIDWDGSTNTGAWLKVTQADGDMLWSSPIWLTDDCKRMEEGAIDPLYVCGGGPTDTEDTQKPTDTQKTSETNDSEDETAKDSGPDAEAPADCGCASRDSFSGGLVAALGMMTLLALRRRKSPLHRRA